MDKEMKIRGSLVYLTSSFTVEDFFKDLDAQEAIGFDILWLSGDAFRYDSLADSRITDKLKSVFEEAGRRKMKIFAEVLGSPDWYTLWDAETENLTGRRIIDLMVERFGGYPSLHGFYLGYEVYITDGTSSEYCKKLFTSLSHYCRAKLPDSKICISPFFVIDQHQILGPYRYAQPEEYYVYWMDMLEGTAIDILMLQDSGAEHVAFLSVEAREPFFEAVKKACGARSVELWGNVELAEINVKNFEELKEYRGGYGRQDSDAKMTDMQWTPVDIDKLDKKIKLASAYCSDLVSWGYQQFMSPYGNRSDARAYYAAYKKYIESKHRIQK